MVSKTQAYLITDSRYWLQAKKQLDHNWHLIAAGSIEGPKDWVEFLVDRAKDVRIGIDARMITHEKASSLNSQLSTRSSKLVYPPQNLVDLIWKEKPPRSKDLIYVQPMEFSGQEASSKLERVRLWIKKQAPSVPSYSKSEAKPSQKQVGTLISELASIGEFS